MKIKSIYIDGLHNAVNKTYEFGDIVYIFGHNGAGKSTILQAIQFALLGYIPGTSKTKDAILRHSPVGKIVVRLALEGDPEVTLERKLSNSGMQLTTIPENYDLAGLIQDLELPIFNFNEFVSQTANKLKDYFIKHILPTSDGKLNWQQILEESIADCNFEDRFEILKYGLGIVGDIDGDALDQVIKANTKFKEEQQFNKSELQRLQNTIDSLIYYDDYIGPTDMNKINSDLLALGCLRDQVIKYNAAVSATQATRTQLADLKEQIITLGGKEAFDSLETEVQELKDKHGDISKAITAKNNELAIIKTEDSMAESIIRGNGVCPYTSEKCKTMQAELEENRNLAASLKAKKIEINSELEALTEDLRNNDMEIKQRESKILKFHTTWERIESLQKTLGDLPEKPDTDKTVMDLDREIEHLTNSKSKLQANIQYNATIENLTAEKFRLELLGEALKHWVKTTDTNGLQTTLMEAPFADLAGKMNTYIWKMYGRSDIRVHFNISNKANSFSFGLIREGTYIPYDLLSSGEKCLYTLSLMICIVSNTASPLKLMLCDDMFDHLDDEAIENTFLALKSITDIQFIFAGVNACKNAEDVLLRIGEANNG